MSLSYEIDSIESRRKEAENAALEKEKNLKAEKLREDI